MIFTNNSTNYVDVNYLKYFQDLDLVFYYSWGMLSLAHLYEELNYVYGSGTNLVESNIYREGVAPVWLPTNHPHAFTCKCKSSDDK